MPLRPRGFSIHGAKVRGRRPEAHCLYVEDLRLPQPTKPGAKYPFGAQAPLGPFEKRFQSPSKIFYLGSEILVLDE
jgi:hypothetical protein